MSDRTETSYFIKPVPRFNDGKQENGSDEESSSDDESFLDSTADTKVNTKYFDHIMEEYTKQQEHIAECETAELDERERRKIEISFSPPIYYTPSSMEGQQDDDLNDEHTSSSESILELIDEGPAATVQKSRAECRGASKEYIRDDGHPDPLLYTKFISLDMNVLGPYVSRGFVDSRLKSLVYWENPLQTAQAAACLIAMMALIKSKSFAFTAAVVVFGLFISLLFLRFTLTFCDTEKRNSLLRAAFTGAALRPSTLRILKQVEILEEEALEFLGRTHDAFVGRDWRYVLRMLFQAFLLITIANIFDGVYQAMIGLTAVLTIPCFLKKQQENSTTKQEEQPPQLSTPNS